MKPSLCLMQSPMKGVFPEEVKLIPSDHISILPRPDRRDHINQVVTDLRSDSSVSLIEIRPRAGDGDGQWSRIVAGSGQDHQTLCFDQRPCSRLTRHGRDNNICVPIPAENMSESRLCASHFTTASRISCHSLRVDLFYRLSRPVGTSLGRLFPDCRITSAEIAWSRRMSGSNRGFGDRSGKCMPIVERQFNPPSRDKLPSIPHALRATVTPPGRRKCSDACDCRAIVPQPMVPLFTPPNGHEMGNPNFSHRFSLPDSTEAIRSLRAFCRQPNL
jgi:hypothetical protein